MRIIPAIDIINGKCVRLSKGVYESKKVYNENPLDVAREFEVSGIEYLHLVDLDGAKSDQIVNYKILESIASKTNLKVDFGGGLKKGEDIKIAFESGVNQITLGSLAVKNPELFLQSLQKYGSDKIILGADCKHRKIATNGWLEGSELEVMKFIKGYKKRGVKTVICTDIDKDGVLEGPSLELYEEILENVEINLIASGGVASIKDIESLQRAGCEGVIIGKAIYENKISLKELSVLC